MIKLAVFFVVGVIARQTCGEEPEAIIGGNNAIDGQFKHQVSLEIEFYGEVFHMCGGSIITPLHILTAAHCVENEDDNKSMKVVTGTISPALKGERHEIKCIRLHPEYTGQKKDGWKHDIAVITLKKPIQINKYQAPIPLATKDYATGEYRGIISGWGKTSMSSDSSEILKWVEVNVLDKESCLKSHKYTPTNPKHICTLEKIGKGACQGDSGGPLMVNNEVAGVVSWVVPCAMGRSDVFTNVFYYLDFIKECQQMC
ncbi:chymotrypsin-1-like [Odontomachus brunneus]|uniref:chymotrypsin-1-like n=1 Tax=Odontomachus brunneus TaxID=486640 RepID=UPI0013F221C7|nr:chymotrypsin-1-like [Odontomachus brunneus]